MKRGLMIFLGTILTIIIIAGISLGTLWNHVTVSNSQKEQVEAQLTANKSSYDNMWKTFVEMTQVTDIQAKQFREVYDGLISQRYKDTNLLFKSIQESNPQLSQSVYTELQRQIAAGRISFSNDQKQIADIIREYNTYLINHPIMKMVTGREKLDSSKYIVTSQRTQNAFSENMDDVVDLDSSNK